MFSLQDMLDAISFDGLPPAWAPYDLAPFSREMRLWDYQQTAVQNALKALWKYYDDLRDYRPDEDMLAANAERKRQLFAWYQENDLEGGLEISLKRARADVVRLLDPYYRIEDDAISYEQLINRLTFWMATGSGKTLVLVKLLEMLWRLSRAGEIPPHDILVLTYREDLIQQLRKHVAAFNAARGDLYIRLRDLREYPDAKRIGGSLFSASEMTVFYYRSDNLSDEQKERIVDFRNYDNDGRWYVLLDEAHKGDREDSKRQHIYSILSRNGFLFNFSATFTDLRDVRTTAFNFNLATFIGAGYGKHIAILTQEARAFKDKEDYTDDEKQAIVLKALLLLAMMSQARASLPSQWGGGVFYHRPLLLTLVNSVNTEEADLKLFFRQLARIGRREIAPAQWERAKAELRSELAMRPGLLFERDATLSLDLQALDALSLADVLALVYNSDAASEMEVLQRPSDRQELAFKLKAAERPFALIKIGDVSEWLREELAAYEVSTSLADEAFFEHLNSADSEINILMGSRAFYEGWDSNRPNVALFINIGTGTDARKFILQSVGRGVRIEPIKGERRRLQWLRNAGIVSQGQFATLQKVARSLEALCIIGTNRQALKTVMEELDRQRDTEAERELALAVNERAVDDHLLLVPRYRKGDAPLLEQADPAKFPILAEELDLLERYVGYLGDDRLMLALHGASPQQCAHLRRSLAAKHKYYTANDARRYGDVSLIVARVLGHLGLVTEELREFTPLADEIRHFEHIRVVMSDIGRLQRAIEKVRDYRDPEQARAELIDKFRRQEIDLNAYTQGVLITAKMVQEETVSYGSGSLSVRYVANHYYTPVILAPSEVQTRIQHVIRTPSEVRFICALEGYLASDGAAFKHFDWWLFSKLDETLDGIYLPYYDPDANRMRRFFPDFVFWLQRGSEYQIVFVDPKGMQQAHYEHKIDGFQRLFGDAATPCVFEHDGLRVSVYLRMYGADANAAPKGYRTWWIDRPEQIIVSP